MEEVKPQNRSPWDHALLKRFYDAFHAHGTDWEKVGEE
jgi:hypothetical protein